MYKSRKSHNDLWIIFDGDNTLWKSEQLYDYARDALCRFLELRGHNYSDVHDFQQTRDKELFHLLGYDRTRFVRSFAETLLCYEPRADEDDINFVAKLASEVFSTPAPPDTYAGSVLKRLSKKYRLALLTAGDQNIQTARVKTFPFVHLFEVVGIVPSKNKETLLNFLSQNNMSKDNTIVIGDSLRSDIYPAVECGLQAVWISNKNWSHIENFGHNLPLEVHHVQSLPDFEKWLNKKNCRHLLSQ